MKREATLYEERYARREKQKELGSFYFLACQNQLCNLTAETAARLVYLCTFMNADRRLIRGRKPLRKADLADVLGLSTGTVHKFWTETYPLYLEEDKTGLIVTHADMVRGSIKGRGQIFKQCYIDSFRRLYKATPPTQHKHLGYVLQLLPNIHPEFNVLCRNPEETDFERIQCLTVREFCKMIDYDAHNAWQLIHKYKSLTFDVNGRHEPFLSVVTEDRRLDHAKLFVHPRIIYGGHDFRKAEALGAFAPVPSGKDACQPPPPSTSRTEEEGAEQDEPAHATVEQARPPP